MRERKEQHQEWTTRELQEDAWPEKNLSRNGKLRVFWKKINWNESMESNAGDLPVLGTL